MCSFAVPTFKEPMIALIDGDVLVYRVGFSSENQSEEQNCFNCDLLIQDLLKKVGADEYRVFLSDRLVNNFRYAVDPEYKANRKDAVKPRWYDSIRSFLIDQYSATVTVGEEADDVLGYTQLGTEKETIICSIDKDLYQIPGRHYNLARGEFINVSPVDGTRHFYKQLLIGDRVDNIRGVTGIGEVKASRLLNNVTDEQQMFEIVRALYSDDQRLLKNGKLLWIRRKPEELWTFPYEVGSEGVATDEGIEGGEADGGCIYYGEGEMGSNDLE